MGHRVLVFYIEYNPSVKVGLFKNVILSILYCSIKCGAFLATCQISMMLVVVMNVPQQTEVVKSNSAFITTSGVENRLCSVCTVCTVYIFSKALGIKCMSLRLQCEMARNIFYTQFLPVIGSEDPIIVKLIRNAHEKDIENSRRLHNLEKTTRANLVRGQTGITWYKQRQHCKNFVGSCGSKGSRLDLHWGPV